MIYLKKFDSHASDEEKLNGGGVDISLPNVSYCKDVKDVHYNPYNTVEFYVGEITEPQTVSIYTDESTSVPIQVSEDNKWYTYLLPKDKGLYTIESGVYDDEEGEWRNGIVTKVVVKADINGGIKIIPSSTIEASFKGSNTSKVTSMNSMFSGCRGLTSLTLSNFDTSKVTNMESMFDNCSGLKSLTLSNFDTSKVTNMNGMFSYCSNLTSLDVSNFDTSKVTSMNSMFSGCRGLTSLTLSNFDISKVTNMAFMFAYCYNLTSLDLSGWNINSSVVINTNGMFNGCTALKTIRMVGCNQTTIDKIAAVKPSGAHISTE